MKLSAKLVVKTGLHIGGADDTMKIGGVDSPVIKREIKWNKDKKRIDYIDGEFISEPYIPGSSLKGKIRSLLEHYFGLHKKILKVNNQKLVEFLDSLEDDEKTKFNTLKGKEFQEFIKKLSDEKKSKYDEYLKINKLLGESINSKHLEYLNENEKKYADLTIKLFGESGGNTDSEEITIASLIFRDSFITKEIREKVLEDEFELTEYKFENVIDRCSGKTKGGGLRQIERVVPGVEFDFEVIIRNINDLDEELAKITLLLGLKLLENDYLGGNGSRGYGEVEFIDIEVDGLDKDWVNLTKKELKDEIDNFIKENK